MNWLQWNKLHNKDKTNHVLLWSKENQSRKPKNAHRSEEEDIYATWILETKQKKSWLLSPEEFESLNQLDWWKAMICPKYRSLQAIGCDWCNRTLYCNVRNKRKNGHPKYFVCKYCQECSVPKRLRAAGMTQEINTGVTHRKSGKSFSRKWTAKYK
jgi:hypothetical protein